MYMKTMECVGVGSLPRYAVVSNPLGIIPSQCLFMWSLHVFPSRLGIPLSKNMNIRLSRDSY